MKRIDQATHQFPGRYYDWLDDTMCEGTYYLQLLKSVYYISFVADNGDVHVYGYSFARTKNQTDEKCIARALDHVRWAWDGDFSAT